MRAIRAPAGRHHERERRLHSEAKTERIDVELNPPSTLHHLHAPPPDPPTAPPEVPSVPPPPHGPPMTPDPAPPEIIDPPLPGNPVPVREPPYMPPPMARRQPTPLPRGFV